jgi:hypothetical protein
MTTDISVSAEHLIMHAVENGRATMKFAAGSGFFMHAPPHKLV